CSGFHCPGGSDGLVFIDPDDPTHISQVPTPGCDLSTARNATYSHAGSRIVFQCLVSGLREWRVEVLDSGASSRIPNPPGWTPPRWGLSAWAPGDGSLYLTYVPSGTGPAGLYAWSVDGGEPKPFVVDPNAEADQPEAPNDGFVYFNRAVQPPSASGI